MLVTVQLAMTDIRVFSERSEPLLRVPEWPQPLDNRYVKFFGPVDRRRRGGESLFPDELYYARANRALRMDGLERRIGPLQPVKCVFRRLLCSLVRSKSVPGVLDATWFADQRPYLIRLEVGLQSAATGVASQQLFDGLRELLDLPCRVPVAAADADRPSTSSENSERTVCLLDAGPALARLYSHATIAVPQDGTTGVEDAAIDGAPSPPQVQWARPIVLVEYGDGDLESLPRQAHALAPQISGGVDVSYVAMEHHGQQVTVWLIRKGLHMEAQIRRLRLALLRVCAEHQALRHVLTALRRRELTYASQTPSGELLELYLNFATWLQSVRKGGIDSSGLRDVLLSYDSQTDPSDQQLLLEELEGARVTIQRKVASYLQPRPRPAPAVFVSYSHQDEGWKDRLVKHFGALSQSDRIDVWNDRRIDPGGLWKSEIGDALRQARFAVLLISADFLNSDFINQSEIPVLLERHRTDGLHVIPTGTNFRAPPANHCLQKRQPKPNA